MRSMAKSLFRCLLLPLLLLFAITVPTTALIKASPSVETGHVTALAPIVVNAFPALNAESPSLIASNTTLHSTPIQRSYSPARHYQMSAVTASTMNLLNETDARNAFRIRLMSKPRSENATVRTHTLKGTRFTPSHYLERS
jgi:hypothetical protein